RSASGRRARPGLRRSARAGPRGRDPGLQARRSALTPRIGRRRDAANHGAGPQRRGLTTKGHKTARNQKKDFVSVRVASWLLLLFDDRLPCRLQPLVERRELLRLELTPR